MASSPEDAMETMIQNLKEKTGKTLDDWLKFIKSKSFTKHGEIVNYLKKDHGVTHGYANLIAHKSLKSDATSLSNETDLVAEQYSGAKTALRPIYDKIKSKIEKFGNDLEISPKKTYVSVRRKKQFAIIQPSTSTRVDVGINLKDEKPTGRLEASGSFNMMVSHRVRIENEQQVDSQLEGWLKKAYEKAG